MKTDAERMTAAQSITPDRKTKPPRHPAAARRDCVTLTLMTYNVERGERWAEVAEVIRDAAADIICLQEVAEESHPTLHFARPSRVQEDLGLPADAAMLWNQSPLRIGNMTLVRGEIEPCTMLEVAGSRPYGMLNRVRVKGTSLVVANLHLTDLMGPPPMAFPITESYRLREAQDVTRRLANEHGPVIATGDLNTFWPAPACLHMRRNWRDCRSAAHATQGATRPTYGLPFVIDHVFCRGPIGIEDYRVIPSPASDHRPVIATLSIDSSCEAVAEYGDLDAILPAP